MSKCGFLAGNCVGSVYALYLLITNTHEEDLGYAPDTVPNPLTTNDGPTYFGSEYEESGRRMLETTWEGFAEKRKRLDRLMARDMTRASAAADIREEIIFQKLWMRWWWWWWVDGLVMNCYKLAWS